MTRCAYHGTWQCTLPCISMHTEQCLFPDPCFGRLATWLISEGVCVSPVCAGMGSSQSAERTHGRCNRQLSQHGHTGLVKTTHHNTAALTAEQARSACALNIERTRLVHGLLVFVTLVRCLVTHGSHSPGKRGYIHVCVCVSPVCVCVCQYTGT